MIKRRRVARRTNSMMRAAGVSQPVPLPLSYFKGGCCKMFFPLNETSGTTIADAIGGVVLPARRMEFVVSNAIRLEVGAGTGHALQANTGVTPSAGVFPTVGQKDFILFAVQRLSNGLARANSYFGMKSSTHSYVGVYDGDGAGIRDAGLDILADTETFTGQDGNPFDVANAIVRNGNALGNWTHAETANAVAQGNTVGAGDVYARVCRGVGYNPAVPGTFGQWARNDHGIPDAVIQTWQAINSSGQYITPPTLSWGGLTFGTSYGGLPGVWPRIDGVYSIDFEQFVVGTNILAGDNDYYGIALFVFDNGLPSDFKEALRWMKSQWVAGNKVIWPDWVSVA